MKKKRKEPKMSITLDDYIKAAKKGTARPSRKCWGRAFMPQTVCMNPRRPIPASRSIET